ncbi:MAG TPA: hypothetical protein VKG84_03300, partial [Candidatus Acidoferrales bacterium]|nr:hypothetical protein [Candidatus Acidoferrales bacterium]
MRPLSQFSRIALAVAALLPALSITAVAVTDSPWRIHLLSNAGQAAILLWATVCALVVARRSVGYLRQLWNLWVASLGTLTAGAALVAYLGSFHATPAATPWPSDILNFLWVTPALMMLIPWPSEEEGKAKWQYTLDFIQVAIVALTAYLYFFYVPAIWEVTGPRMFERLREASVARDAVMAGAFLVRTTTLPRSATRSFFARMTGIFLAVATFDFIGMSQFGQFNKGAEWIGATWSVPYLLATAFAATWDTSRDRDIPAPGTTERAWAPSQILAVCIPLLVILMGARIAREQMTMAWVTIGVSFACSAARLILTSERQHRIAEDLRRTEQALRRSERMFESAFRASP